jgi:hypothetical protein
VSVSLSVSLFNHHSMCVVINSDNTYARVCVCCVVCACACACACCVCACGRACVRACVSIVCWCVTVNAYSHILYVHMSM